MGHNVACSVLDIKAKLVLCYSDKAVTANYVSKYKVKVPILVITTCEVVARQANALYGQYACVEEEMLVELTKHVKYARKLGIYQEGPIVVVSGATEANSDLDPAFFIFSPTATGMTYVPSSNAILGQHCPAHNDEVPGDKLDDVQEEGHEGHDHEEHDHEEHDHEGHHHEHMKSTSVKVGMTVGESGVVKVEVMEEVSEPTMTVGVTLGESGEVKVEVGINEEEKACETEAHGVAHVHESHTYLAIPAFKEGFAKSVACGARTLKSGCGKACWTAKVKEGEGGEVTGATMLELCEKVETSGAAQYRSLDAFMQMCEMYLVNNGTLVDACL